MIVNKFSHSDVIIRVPKQPLMPKIQNQSTTPVLPEGNSPAWYWALGILAAICLAAYSNSFYAGFHLDDKGSILNNVVIHRIDIKRIWDFFPKRFIPHVSFALNYQWNAHQLFGYHAINLIIHWLSSVAAWQLTRLTFRTPALINHPLRGHADTIALFSAAIFAAHPLQTQSVTYIVQRMTSMAGLFYLSTLCCYAKAKLDKRPVFFAGAILAMIAGFLTKQNTYTLPFAIILYDSVFFEAKISTIFKKTVSYIPWFVPLMLTYFTLYHGEILSGESTYITKTGAFTLSRSEYFLTQLNVIRTYLRLCFFPVNQNADYDYPVSHSLLEIPTLVSFIMHMAIVASSFLVIRKQPLIAFGILWFYLTLSLESSFIPISDVIFEHRLYLPIYGFSLVAISLLYLFLGQYRQLVTACIIVIFMFCFMTFMRNRVWENELTLWQDVVQKSPRKARALVSLGSAYGRMGQTQKTLELHQKAVEVQPDDFVPYNALGTTYHLMGKYDKALDQYQKAIALYPDYIEAHFNMGVTYLKQEQYDSAITHFQKVIAVNPHYLSAYQELGVAYGLKEEYDLAIEILKKALAVDPDFHEAVMNLALAYIKKGDVENAQLQIAELRRLKQSETADRLEKNIHKIGKTTTAFPAELVETSVTYFNKDGKFIQEEKVPNAQTTRSATKPKATTDR